MIGIYGSEKASETVLMHLSWLGGYNENKLLATMFGNRLINIDINIAPAIISAFDAFSIKNSSFDFEYGW